MTKLLPKLLQQLLPNRQPAENPAMYVTFEPVDGFSNFKKVNWSELNFKFIEVPPSEQAVTKDAARAAT